jgi:hypothetical protein
MRTAYLLLLAARLAMAAGPLQLSLKRAVEVAVSPEGSAHVQLADEALKQAQARALEQRAALLPNVDAAFSDQSRTENLAALGFNPAIFSAIPIPGFSFPTFVGPFTTVDARVSGSQSVFDFSTIRRYQASKVGVTAARSDVDATQEQVALKWRAPTWPPSRAMPTWTPRWPTSLSRSAAHAVGPRERSRHGNGHRDHPRQSATGQRPPAPAGGAERPPQRPSATPPRHRSAARHGDGIDRQAAIPARGRRHPGCRQGAGPEGASRPQGAAGARSQRAALGQRHQAGAAALAGGIRRLRLERHGPQQLGAHAHRGNPGEGADLRWRPA